MTPQRFNHEGNIKVYRDGRVIYSKAFISKGHLLYIMKRYEDMEMSIIYKDKEFEHDKRWKI